MSNARRRTPDDDRGRPARLVCAKGDRTAPGIEPNPREASQMQRIAEGRSLPDRSHPPVRRKGRLSSACTGRNTGAPGVVTLAPAFTHALPALDGMPTAYSHEFHAELLYELCAALVGRDWECQRRGTGARGAQSCSRSAQSCRPSARSAGTCSNEMSNTT